MYIVPRVVPTANESLVKENRIKFKCSLCPHILICSPGWPTGLDVCHNTKIEDDS